MIYLTENKYNSLIYNPPSVLIVISIVIGIYFSSKNKADLYINNDAIYYGDEEIIKLKDIKEIFKIADTANTFVCDQELWNKIISYDYSSIAKPEKPKKEPKPKVEKTKKEPKIKKEVESKTEEPKQEEVVEVKVEEEKPEEEKPKETKKKTTKKAKVERVKRETKPKAKKEVKPKAEKKEMSEADILNSISVDTSVLELDDVRQDFNLE